MLSLDEAFERIATAFREMGYTFTKEERSPDSSGDRLAVFTSPKMAMRMSWNGKARLMALQIEADGEWVDFSRIGFGPGGLEESAVAAMVRAVRNEVGETSTDSD
jgi:hypothetical protein